MINKNSDWWRAAVLILLFSLPAFGQAEDIPFTFTRVVDTNTPIPGGPGNFMSFADPLISFGYPAASIEDGVVVFAASGPAPHHGLYAAEVGGAITTLADINTLVPDGTGRQFQFFGTPSFSQGNVAFIGAAKGFGVPGRCKFCPIAEGVYFADRGGSIRTVADRNTPVPGVTAAFRRPDEVALDGENIAFVYSTGPDSSRIDEQFIVVADKLGQMTVVADSEEFGFFKGVSFDRGIVAFTSSQQTIYAAPVGRPPVPVVSLPPDPGGGTVFTGNNPSIDNGSIAFLATGYDLPVEAGIGIYTASLQGSITPVALVGTPIPGGTGNFINFDTDGPPQGDGTVAFRGFGPSGQEGIYARIGGVLTKVLDLTDSLDGKTLTHVSVGYEAVSGNQIVFAAGFSDGSSGIYVAQHSRQPSSERLVVQDVQVSSEWTFSLQASHAADGDPLTRWSSEFSDAQFIQVDLGQDTLFDRIVLRWELARAAEYEIQGSTDGETWTTLRRVATSGDVDDLSDLVGFARYVRMQGLQRATPWGYSLFEFEVYRDGVNIAAGRPMMASSAERMVFPGRFAVDGDPSTRWMSDFADAQWLAVDLGINVRLDRAVLNWDAAYAADYDLVVSNDGSSWTTVRTVTDADGGIDELTDLTAEGRYVGLLLHRRGTPWGFSLWEFEVFGSPTGIAP